MSSDRTKRVNIDFAFVETLVHGCELTLKIYDCWKDDRKLQPCYVMQLTPRKIEYLIRKLGLGLIAIEDHVATQRRLAIAALKGDDA